MEILENVLSEELGQIFDENNQNFVSDRECLFNDNFLKLVAVENGHAVAFLTLYIGSDFIEKEEYPIKLNMKEKSVYIWNGITKKDYEGKGYQTQLMKYTKNKFHNYDIYNVVDITNSTSNHICKKIGFKKILNFEKEYDGILEKFILYKISATSDTKELIDEK